MAGEPMKCSGRVSDGNNRWPKYFPCSKPGKMEHDGKWWCGIHDPVRRKAKADAAHQKFEQEYRDNQARRDQATAFIAALGVDGHPYYDGSRGRYTGGVVLTVADCESLMVRLGVKA